MNKKILTFEFLGVDINEKTLGEYTGANFIERVQNMVKDIEGIKKEYFIYKEKILPLLKEKKVNFTQKTLIGDIVNIENIISEFLYDYFKINSFFIGNNLFKKIKNNFFYNGNNLYYFELLLEQLGVFIKQVNLDKIPYIPKSNLYSITENGVLYAELDGEKIVFRFEYLTGKKYLEEYKKNSIFYKEKNDKLYEKKDYILGNKNQFDGKYFDILKDGIFKILDLIKKNKLRTFGEVFYENKLSNNFSNNDFLIELNDFLIEFKDIFKSNPKLNVLFNILEKVIEETYEKNFIYLQVDLGVNLNIKFIQTLKIELFLFIEKLKAIS